MDTLNIKRNLLVFSYFFQLIFQTVPTIALNGYCLIMYTRDAQLRSASFYLVGVQAFFEFVISGFYSGLFNMYSVAFFYIKICVTIQSLSSGYDITEDLNDFPFSLLKATLDFSLRSGNVTVKKTENESDETIKLFTVN